MVCIAPLSLRPPIGHPATTLPTPTTLPTVTPPLAKWSNDLTALTTRCCAAATDRFARIAQWRRGRPTRQSPATVARFRNSPVRSPVQWRQMDQLLGAIEICPNLLCCKDLRHGLPNGAKACVWSTQFWRHWKTRADFPNPSTTITTPHPAMPTSRGSLGGLGRRSRATRSLHSLLGAHRQRLYHRQTTPIRSPDG
jgi:hypothetical protein